jgi:hypothetical protein
MSRVDALDAFVTSVGTKVGAGATAATATTNGEVNVNGTLIGLAQATQSVGKSYVSEPVNPPVSFILGKDRNSRRFTRGIDVLSVNS